MPHGTVDWAMDTEETLYALVDNLAEIPPRLGHPSSIDRRGEVLLMEVFNRGNGACRTTSAGLGETTALSPDFARYSSFSHKLRRIANAASYATVCLSTPVISPTRIGVEAHFITPLSYPMPFLSVIRNDSNKAYTWGLKWDAKNNVAYLDHPAGDPVEIGPIHGLTLSGGYMRVMKLVIDVVTLSYVRAIIDGVNLTLPDADPYETTNTKENDVSITFANWKGLTTASNIYVNALIITLED